MWDVVRDIVSGTEESVDPNDTELKIVEKGESYPTTTQKQSSENTVLELNLDALEYGQREEVISRLYPTFDSQEGLFESETNKDIRVAEAGITDDEINSIIEFFNHHLSEKNIDLLRRSLYLRKSWESNEDYTSQKEIGRRRSELASQFGHKAYSVTNLCSSGYFDTDGYITSIFKSIDGKGQTDPEDMFDTIVDDVPFTVYIGKYDDAPEVKTEIIEKINSNQRYPFRIEFLDVRAQGGGNRSTLENVWMDIQRDANKIRFEGDIDDRESILRIYLDSVSEL